MTHPLDQKRTVTLEQLDRWRTILRDLDVAGQVISKQDLAKLQELHDGLVAAWEQPQPQVDREHAKSQLLIAQGRLDGLLVDWPTWAEGIRRRADQVAGQETQVKLWDDVVRDDWNAAVTRLGGLYRSAWMGGNPDQVTHAQAQARGAQLWWRANVRRALTEGLDLESVAWAVI